MRALIFSRARTEKKAPVSPVPLGPSGCNWQASLGVMLNVFSLSKPRTIKPMSSPDFEKP
jgi:hypothetical protein